ncbi:MAG: hypothetical protein GSR80_000214 [Desulfurococcales archaeon]|nr:hypothetical protein [Desulfurococcales archaeon]
MGRRIDEFLAGGRRGGTDRCGSADTRRELEELKAGLEELKREIEDLRSECMRRIDAILGEMRALRRAQVVPSRESRRGQVQRLRRVLRELRFVMASEARARLGMSPHRLRAEAAAEGLVVIDAGGDFAVMTRDSLQEFKALLASLRTADAAEAAKALGEYGRLFQALREGGQVYYDARRKRWVMLGE